MIMMNTLDNNKQILDLRLLIHNHLYEDSKVNADIISALSEKFNLFSIDFNLQNRAIYLKIKKTNMKKSVDYSHTSSYYYTILNGIFYKMFNDNRPNILSLIDKYKSRYNLVGYDIDHLLSFENISLSYNVTTISDNIVVIYL